MNYLELCKKVCSEAGISSTNPTSVKNQVGIINKIVGWVAEADLNIQTEFADWRFLWARSSFSFVVDREEYTPGDVGISGSGVIEERQVDAITIDGLPLTQLTWEAYLQDVERTGAQDNKSQPKAFAVQPSGSFVFYPIADSTYSAKIDFYQSPLRLTENTDVSVIPVKYHMAIAWQALMYYAAQEGDTEIFAMAEINYNKLYDKLVLGYAPAISMGGNIF